MTADIIRAYKFARAQQQTNAIDACCDTAAWFGIPAADLAAWIIASDIDRAAHQRLALITP